MFIIDLEDTRLTSIKNCKKIILTTDTWILKHLEVLWSTVSGPEEQNK